MIFLKKIFTALEHMEKIKTRYAYFTDLRELIIKIIYSYGYNKKTL